MSICKTCGNTKCRDKQPPTERTVYCSGYIKPPTNADRIRAMTDEELAALMLQINDIDSTIRFCQDLPECQELLETEDGIPVQKCEKCLLAWLQQPAEEVSQ